MPGTCRKTYRRSAFPASFSARSVPISLPNAVPSAKSSGPLYFPSLFLSLRRDQLTRARYGLRLPLIFPRDALIHAKPAQIRGKNGILTLERNAPNSTVQEAVLFPEGHVEVALKRTRKRGPGGPRVVPASLTRIGDQVTISLSHIVIFCISFATKIKIIINQDIPCFFWGCPRVPGNLSSLRQNIASGFCWFTAQTGIMGK